MQVLASMLGLSLCVLVSDLTCGALIGQRPGEAEATPTPDSNWAR